MGLSKTAVISLCYWIMLAEVKYSLSLEEKGDSQTMLLYFTQLK